MKSAILFAWCFFITAFAFAQKYEITESEVAIKGISRKGQRLLIQLDSRVVERAWENHLREKAGKMGPAINLSKLSGGANGGVTLLEKVKIDTISKTPVRIVSKVESTAEGAAVWWSIDLGNAYLSKEGTPQQYAAAEGFLKNFARKLYRDDIMRQVTEAEKVLKNTQNEETRVIKQADELKRNLDRNAARKLELEAELARNIKEKEKITADIENNRRQQETAKQEVENMKKAVEAVRTKINTVE